MSVAVGSILMNHWRAWLGLAFLALAIGLVALVRWVETTPGVETESVASVKSVVVAVPETPDPKSQDEVSDDAHVSADINPSPSFLLTDEEVAALSPAEQQQYLRMLESLQDIQQQVEVLEQEQSQLEQRVHQRVEENEALHDELDEMREGVKLAPGQDAENNAVTDNADGVPGKAH